MSMSKISVWGWNKMSHDGAKLITDFSLSLIILLSLSIYRYLSPYCDPSVIFQ